MNEPKGHFWTRLGNIECRLGYLLGRSTPHWARVVQIDATEKFVKKLPAQKMDSLEISGSRWKRYPFRSYSSVFYPEYDFCDESSEISSWDIVFAEHVLEHLLAPWKAVRNAYQMLRPGGWFIVATPFLVRVHNAPIDCSRWTATGLKYLLEEGGFHSRNIKTGSWGNRACVIANLERWVKYKPLLHSLDNDPRYPVVVWAFAMKEHE